MNRVVIIPEAEFETLMARIERLEELTRPVPVPTADKVFNVPEAGVYLRMTPEGIRKARRQKRLTGFLINEKEWGFHQSELDRYKKRYNRS